MGNTTTEVAAATTTTGCTEGGERLTLTGITQTHKAKRKEKKAANPARCC